MKKLLVISSYPSKGEIHHRKTVGIASYAKNTLLGIKKNEKDIDILVLAEELYGESKKYQEDGISVKRVWKRGSFLTFPKLIKEVFKANSDKILLEFEVSMFGNPLTLIPLPLFIVLQRILGKEVIVVSHQAITNLKDFEGHTNIKTESVKGKVLGMAINMFYKSLAETSNKVIVFEQALKDKLAKGNEKIVVIPHGVQNIKTKWTKSSAKKKLGIKNNQKVVMIFGYIAWYKGTDWLVDTFSKIKNNGYTLIVAGGPNPNHKDKKFYMDYVGKIKSKANGNIVFTGFVDEKDIPLYFQASDLVLLPYRAFMSASGPLSLAYSFEKPALISSALSPILKTEDIKQAIKSSKLAGKDLIFELDRLTLEKALKTSHKGLEGIAKSLKKSRSFESIGKEYLKVIYER